MLDIIVYAAIIVIAWLLVFSIAVTVNVNKMLQAMSKGILKGNRVPQSETIQLIVFMMILIVIDVYVLKTLLGFLVYIAK